MNPTEKGFSSIFQSDSPTVSVLNWSVYLLIKNSLTVKGYSLTFNVQTFGHLVYFMTDHLQVLVTLNELEII